MMTLKAARVNKELTQKKAADLIGVNVSTLSKWEKGKSYPTKNDDEKSRASEIVKQLKGMSIREAQHFLSKVSEALIDSQML